MKNSFMLIKKTKEKKTKDYLKTRVELKLFERKLDFLNLFVFQINYE